MGAYESTLLITYLPSPLTIQVTMEDTSNHKWNPL